jgi:hypothetical protein
MPVRLFHVGVAILLAGALALPACKKKDGGPTGSTLGLEATPRSRALSQNSLKQIGIAMHWHMGATGFLPAGIYGPDGKSIGLSWRVAILPYIEEDRLYKQFKFNEPWDSEHNKKLIDKMPRIYAPPDVDTNGHTYFRTFSGPGAVMDVPAGRDGQPGQPVHVRPISAFRDGTSNTLMVVEAAEAVIWTKPDELEFKPNGPLPKLGGVYRDGLNVLLCEGSVRWVQGEIRPDTLKALITTDGGEVVGEW